MTIGKRTLTEAEVERLSILVGRRLADLRDPDVRAPTPADFVAEEHWSPSNRYDLAVDVDVGTTVLTIRNQSGGHFPMSGGRVDLDALSRDVMMHVFLAVADEPGIERLGIVEAAVRAKIARGRLPMELLSVRFAPAGFGRPQPLADRGFWVRMRLLDDLLQPYVELVEGRSAKEACQDVGRLRKAQTARRNAKARLDRQGAFLEIEAVAEHAILAAGRTVGEVVETMLAERKEGVGCGRHVTLWGHLDGEHVSVVARYGRLRLEADLPGIRLTWNTGLRIRPALRDPVASTRSWVVGDLVRHPLLPTEADVQLEAADAMGATFFRLVEDVHPIQLAGPVGS
ncbi:hypothetical protein [Sphingomonas sp. RIT328]|uniref:hypothetical protein n=1 Tax=Sphingomonas sp. RIT328 TaxID=1470591 RepID=UPI00044DE7DE|nr:hypothetical protein [Sphingomonas sp. RIT328]EZP50058.1 hypothetical protein BW41_03383 [Sphingomonas sp. RIT328]